MRPRKLSAKTADRLQDEICHQMLRLEAGRPSAQLLLAVALLKAWMMLEGSRPIASRGSGCGGSRRFVCA